MKIIKAQNLACPIDGGQLEPQEKQLVCENGHTFDIARQGYVNLLAVQQKRSKQPGDSKEMVLARAQLLNSGLYEPIANTIVDIAFARIGYNQPASLMDAGCGDGYYLDFLFNKLMAKEGSNELSFLGLDISKPAIIEAAKTTINITIKYFFISVSFLFLHFTKI